MHLSLEQQIVCRRDLELLELCIKDTEHRFYREMLINAMQTARHKPISAVMYNRISVSIRRSTEHKSIQSDVTDDSW